MTHYEIATLKTVIFGAGKAAAGLEAWLGAGTGTLLGAFATDIGPLNEVYVLRGFDTLEAMMAERRRALLSADPMGCSAFLVDLRFDSYVPFDFLPPVATGALGPVYEFRSYRTRLNGIAETQEKWRGAVPGRSAYSPLLFAGWGLDGPPRVAQIWPYASLAARAEARSRSVSAGAWPAKGGPDWLLPEMTSAIALPLPFSPLQ